jgi:hypothetical protein
MQYYKYKNNLFIFLTVVLSVFITSILWSKINLPYTNKYNVMGLYSSLNYSSYNDVFRYVFFITFPILTFSISLYLFKKNKLITFNDLISIKNSKFNYKQESKEIIFFYYLAFLFLIIIQFLSLSMPDFKLEYWHDGDYLTAAYNYSLTNKIWGSSYSVHGASMSLYPNLMWKIFGIESIGAYRLFPWFLIISIKFISLYFAYQLSKICSLNKIFRNIFFILFSFLILSMSDYGSLAFGYNLIAFRDIYLYLYIIILFNIIVLNKIDFINILFITIIPSLTMLFHIDIGIYLNFSLIFLIVYFYFINEKNKIFIITSLFFSFWLIAIFFLGPQEFFLYIKNIPIMISSIDYVHGWIHPEPFFDIGELKHASRATKGLLIQLFAGLIVAYKVFIKNDFFDNRKKIFFLFLFLLSFIFYRTALGRSDVFHIRMSGDLPLIIISFFCLEYILFNLEKLNFFSNKKIINYFTIIFFSSSFFYLTQVTFSYSNIKNINHRYIKFVQLNNEYFMHKDTINLINYMNKVAVKDECVQNFTNDHALPYLLKKRTCTTYYASLLASPDILQNDYINQLIKNKPSYIIYKSDKYLLDNLEIYERLKLVSNYINLNYDFHKKIDGYEIYKIIEVN